MHIYKDVIAESASIQGIIQNPEIAIEVVGSLARDCFTDPAFQILFDAAQICAMSGSEVNQITIKGAIEAARASTSVRKAALLSLSEFSGTVYPTKLKAAVSRLKTMRDARDVSGAAARLQIMAEERPELVLESFLQEAMKIAVTDSSSDENVRIGALLDGVVLEAQDAIHCHQTGEMPKDAITTGLKFLNYILTYLRAGDMTTIGAETGGGKSTWSRIIALAAAMIGHPMYIVLTEMTRNQFLTGLACNLAGISVKKIRRGEYAPDSHEFTAYCNALNEISNLPITIAKGRDLDSIILNYKRWRLALPKDVKVPGIIVDYIGKISVKGQNRASKEERTAIASDRLSSIADSDGVHVFCLTQLNKEFKKRPDRRPELGDSRYSAAIEHDSATVMYLYDPKKHFEKVPVTEAPWPEGYMEILVVKSRFSGQSICPITMDYQKGIITSRSGQPSPYESTGYSQPQIPARSW